MELLYSNILPLRTTGHQRTIVDCFREQLAQADSVDIAVGYVSRASLEEIDQLVDEMHVTHIVLTIGMYFIEGMPEGAYRIAMRLNEKWASKGIGEVRIVKSFKYHGKVYLFSRKENDAENSGMILTSAIIGSANFGVIKPEAANLRQYETAVFVEEQQVLQDTKELIQNLNARCSDNIANVEITLVREQNISLDGVDTVEKIPDADVCYYENHVTDICFPLPVKVPAYNERMIDDNRHYTKSNLNVCYAAPRSARKSRDWYETQFTVSTSVRCESDGSPKRGYPLKNVPFVVITDDGYKFKCHTTSQNNKQFSAVGDELILGRWLKGRLVAAGLVRPVNDTGEDHDRQSMITKEMLDEYGCNSLLLTKTDCQIHEDGNVYDVWLLSFKKGSEDEQE